MKANKTLFYNRRENIIPAMKPTEKAKKALMYKRGDNIISAKKKAHKILFYSRREAINQR